MTFKNCLITILFATFLTGVQSGCNFINPAEPIPTFFSIDSFATYDSTNKVGQSYPEVTSVFAYFNGASIGVFELPAKIPVVMDKPGELFFVPGIALNGVTSYQKGYSLYYSTKVSQGPQPGKVVQLNPTTGYRSTLQSNSLLFFEGFDNSSQFINLNSDTSIVPTNEPEFVFSGARSGLISVDEAHPFSESVSTSYFAPQLKETFLELNYKNTAEFQVGVSFLLGNQNVVSYYLVGFKSSEIWRKAYIPLNEVMNLYPGAERIYIILKSTLPEGEQSGNVALDNIRVIHI